MEQIRRLCFIYVQHIFFDYFSSNFKKGLFKTVLQFYFGKLVIFLSMYKFVILQANIIWNEDFLHFITKT